MTTGWDTAKTVITLAVYIFAILGAFLTARESQEEALIIVGVALFWFGAKIIDIERVVELARGRPLHPALVIPLCFLGIVSNYGGLALIVWGGWVWLT